MLDFLPLVSFYYLAILKLVVVFLCERILHRFFENIVFILEMFSEWLFNRVAIRKLRR